MSQVQGAASAAYPIPWYLQPLQQPQSSDATSSEQTRAGGSAQTFDPFAGLGGGTQPSGGAPTPPFSLDTMSALIGAQEQSGGLSSHQQKVFGELDADGDGTVTATELQSAFGPNNKDAADYVMNKLDTNGDGAISQSEFAAGTTRGAGHHHHMHAGPPPGDGSQGAQGAQDPLAALLSSSADGSSSQSSSNSDGSTTTTITYADGSKVSMTSAAAASGSSGNDGSVSSNSPQQQTQQNLLQQLIKLQAQLTQNFSATSPGVTI
jgi:hypothetical protein